MKKKMNFINDADYKVEIRDRTGENNKVIWRCPYHKRWDKMKSRISYSNYAPSYENVTICEEWYKFSNFRKWITSFNVDITNLELDKDFLSGTVYSPETCILIPKYINNSIIDSKKRRGEYPLGVTFESTMNLTNRFKSSIRIDGKNKNIGRYNTSLEAHKAWQLEKIIHFEKLIDRYRTEELFFPVVEQKFKMIIEKIKKEYENNEETIDYST